MSCEAVSKPPVAVILAAGKGTRMRSSRPKVLHEVAGKPLLRWVLEAARACGCDRCFVVVGHGAEDVRQAFSDDDIVWIEQTEQLGTGHALAQVHRYVGDVERLLVLSGDVPAVRAATLESLLRAAEGKWGAMVVAEMDSPGALGRVVLRDDQSLERIVEAADATSKELALRTVNAGIYVLSAPSVFQYLASLDSDNAKGELYLTDALGAAAEAHPIATLVLNDWREALGVNTRRDLVLAQRALVSRHIESLMESGVTVYDPSRTVIEPSVDVGRDSEIHPNVTLAGDTVIGECCTVQTGAWIRNSRVEAHVSIGPYSVLDGASVGAQASIGPFARLRPGADLGRAVRVGNFVEIKNARLDDGVKAGHLAYLGDAEIGEEANIGAGAITCNYDGREKHRTKIGRKAFIGSDTMLVAPVEVGDEAVTAAGSVITNDVEKGALGVSRSRQRNIRDWGKRRRDEDD
jgi:bifunctional UDP-N-acetylglucosamine pyrophosphorylase/glucosamine-1-phosphate N-acetyltransferase